MNADIFQARWSQVRSEAQKHWNKLTDEDLDRARGHVDRLVNALEERYGLSRKKAEKQLDNFIEEYASSDGQASNMLVTVRTFVNENPWAAVIAAVLLLGVVVTIFARPRISDM